MIAALLMIAALSQSPASAGVSVELTVRAALPNLESKVVGSLLMDVRRPTLLYVHAPKTLCEGVTISHEKPEAATYGWSVEIVPVAATASGATIKYSRLWFNGAPTRSAMGARGLRLDDPKWARQAVLDRVDGGSRIEVSLKLQRLKNLDAASAEAGRLPEISADPIVAAHRAAIEDIERQLAQQRQRVGERHPDILRLKTDLQMKTAQEAARKAVVIRTLIDQYESATVPMVAVDGCNVLTATLEASLAKPVAARIIEAELWFVHRAPDGKEATQRQAVRMRDGGRADFYFDDLSLNAAVAGRSEPIALEVFGTIEKITVAEGGDITLNLQLTRRFINPKATALGIPPRIGRGEYPITVGAGEVVSFVLPPLDDDRGQLLGHRFSVRLRLRPLADD